MAATALKNLFLLSYIFPYHVSSARQILPYLEKKVLEMFFILGLENNSE
jgi:hypothetical protein